MKLPHVYKKIVARLANQYGNWNKEWSAHRESVRQSITGTRLTKRDADLV